MRRILAGMAAGATAVLALATPAQANEDISKEWDVASKGAVGWSCPAGTAPVAASVKVTAEHPVATSAAMAPDTQYPHYKTGPGETGWYVVNGDTPQKIKLEFTCAEPTQTSPSPSASVKPKPKNCEAYLYAGTKQNLCDRFADATKAKCADVKYRVTLVDKNVDPWGLDGSGGGSRGVIGVGCESNPLRPVKSASPAPAGVAGGQSAGSLPVTGVPARTIGIAAGVLLVAGGLLVVATRRRRTTA